jgi:hypothetical protein
MWLFSLTRLDEQSTDSSFWSKILPIEFDIGRGAIVVGNYDLPSLVVLDWRTAVAHYKVMPSRLNLDQGKFSLHMLMEAPKLQIRSNQDYRGDSGAYPLRYIFV